MYNKFSFSAVIVGTREGELWYGGSGRQQIEAVINDDETLREAVERILKPDFQPGTRLIPDSCLRVTLYKPNRRITRFFDITLFKSISDLIL